MQYHENFLSPAEADHLLKWCLSTTNVSWQREQFSIFGKTHCTPRETAWFGVPDANYHYAGTDHRCHGWPVIFSELANSIGSYFKLPLNFVLLNKYADGKEHMGWHRDNEPDMQSMIASISLGVARRFRHRQKERGPSQYVDLQHGSLLLFDPSRYHSLPKSMRIQEPRVNLTFRQIKLREYRELHEISSTTSRADHLG